MCAVILVNSPIAVSIGTICFAPMVVPNYLCMSLSHKNEAVHGTPRHLKGLVLINDFKKTCSVHCAGLYVIDTYSRVQPKTYLIIILSKRSKVRSL